MFLLSADDVLLLASLDCELRCSVERFEAECDTRNGGLLNLGEGVAAATNGAVQVRHCGVNVERIVRLIVSQGHQSAGFSMC